MGGVVVLEPSGELLEDGNGVWPGVHAGIVALQGFDESLADTVAFGAADRREAWNQVQRRGEVDGLCGGDRLVPTLGHAPPPLEQQAGGDAVEPGDGGDRHAGLHGLLDQPDLFLGSVASAAFAAGNDFNALDGPRLRSMPMFPPRPSRLRSLSSRVGGGAAR